MHIFSRVKYKLGKLLHEHMNVPSRLKQEMKQNGGLLGDLLVSGGFIHPGGVCVCS